MTFPATESVIARGAEAKLRYGWSKTGAVYANYTHESLTFGGAQQVDERGTPSHKFNFGAMADLTHGFSASVNAGWKDDYLSSAVLGRGQGGVRAYWRLDARAAYAYKGAEFFVAGQNLTRPAHQVEFNGLDVPRTFYGGCSAKF